MPTGEIPAGTRAFRGQVNGSGAPASRPTRTGIFGQLCDEWDRLCRLSSTRHNLRRWARAEPVLGGTDSLGDLLDRIDAGDDGEADRLLLALVRLAQVGQQLAGRVVLQAMLPKIARMSRTLRPSSNDDRWAEDRRHIAVATFWEIIYVYPADRRESRVAANLALDTLHRLTSDRRKPMVEIPLDPEEAAGRLAQRSYVDPHECLGTITADSSLLEVITWGVEVAAISRDEASLLVRTYLPPPGAGGGAGVAGEIDVSRAAVRQRVSRARRRLIAAVRADVEPDAVQPLAV